MAKLLKLRRGTNTQHSTFTGAEGEVTVNTTNDSLHVHDGTTAGGTELAKADLSNAAGASIPGTLTVNKLVVDDDGQGGAVCSIRSDDGAPWAFVVGNDTYSSNENDGLRIYQADNGDVFLDIKGASNYEDFNIRANNGTTAQNCLRVTANREVTLHHQGAQKLATTSTGIDVTGTVTCDGMQCDGNVTIEAGDPALILKDSDNTGAGTSGQIQARTSADEVKWRLGDFSQANEHLNVWNNATSDIVLSTNNGGKQINFTTAGHWVPADNNAQDLGTSTNQWRNAYFDGTVNCDGLTSDGDVTIRSGFGTLNLQDTDNTVAGAQTQVVYRDSAGTIQGKIGYLANNNNDLYIANELAAPLVFTTNGTSRALVDANGHFLPSNNNTYDLGSSGNRWRNVYTNDLNLSNEGGSNDVDGTWGSWTIQEGEDDLFLLNRRNGKKYKFNLSEVN